jgi:diguanylate cyclase (GGDEF)-like protein/hemerythrin-like metal-binding protein
MRTPRLVLMMTFLKRASSQMASRFALPLALLVFLLVAWGNQHYPGEGILFPFYCIAIALLAWYRQAASAYIAALFAVLLSGFYDASRAPPGPIDWMRVVFMSLPDLTMFVGTAFATTRARVHFKRLRLAADSLERLAFHDLLTGLPNRSLLYDRLATAISQARRARQTVALLLLDLDGFKAINDQYSHQAGDEVLKAVARRLDASVRSGDTVARLGGDEFAIVLCNINGPRDAENFGVKILASVAQPITARAGDAYQIGVSIGISLFPEHGSEIDKLLSCADAAMYQSKSRGKNTCTIFSLPGAHQPAPSWIVFNQSNETGYRDIDEQHHQLVDLANQLNTAINSGYTLTIIKRQFEELVLFTRFHFSTEERLMEQYDYPRQDEHKHAHTRLLEELAHIKLRLQQEGGELIALQTLKDWLLAHIENMDKPLGDYLKQHAG